jgi:hypothetical protein
MDLKILGTDEELAWKAKGYIEALKGKVKSLKKEVESAEKKEHRAGEEKRWSMKEGDIAFKELKKALPSGYTAREDQLPKAVLRTNSLIAIEAKYYIQT